MILEVSKCSKNHNSRPPHPPPPTNNTFAWWKSLRLTGEQTWMAPRALWESLPTLFLLESHQNFWKFSLGSGIWASTFSILPHQRARGSSFLWAGVARQPSRQLVHNVNRRNDNENLAGGERIIFIIKAFTYSSCHVLIIGKCYYF